MVDSTQHYNHLLPRPSTMSDKMSGETVCIHPTLFTGAYLQNHNQSLMGKTDEGMLH